MYRQSFIQLLIEFGPAELQGAILWVPAPRCRKTRTESEVIHPLISLM